jgi:molybdopterin biosynthesis enzyme
MRCSEERYTPRSKKECGTMANESPPQIIDTNSAYFAKYCFSLGISLKRIEVIGDEEEEIIEAARRMSDAYDFVVTR